MMAHHTEDWVYDLKQYVTKHIDYIINVSLETGMIKIEEEASRRAELWTLPVEHIYKISEQAEIMYENHNDVIMLDRLLSEIKEHGKEFVLKKYTGKKDGSE